MGSSRKSFVLPLFAVAATAVAQAPRFVPSEETNPLGHAVSVVVDVDGDGDADVVGADGVGPSPAIAVNDGTGRFVAVSPAGAAASFGASARVAVADLNGDGLLDVAFGVPGNVAVRFATAPGVFSTSNAPTPAPPLSPSLNAQYSVAAGDVDLDGDADLLVCVFAAGFFNSIVSQPQLWLNSGSGTFVDATATSGLAVGNVLGRLVDLDGDGLVDALGQVVQAFPSMPFLAVIAQRNLGGGAFGPVVPVGGVLNGAAGGCAAPLATADLDGDGLLDVLMNGPASGQAQWSRQTSPFVFVAQAPTNVGPGCVLGVAATDLDGNGVSDPLLLFGDRVEARPLAGGALGPPTAVVEQGGESATVGDADGDGDGDLLVADNRGLRRWIFNDGAGGLVAPYGRTPAGRSVMTTPVNGWTPSPLAVDLNGDGAPDFAAASGVDFGTAAPPPVDSGSLVFAVNDGEGAFTTSTAGLAGTGSYSVLRLLAALDAEADGDVDFIVEGFANGGASPYALAVDGGSGSFTAQPLPAPTAGAVAQAIARDFDGDGDVDAALAPVSAGTSVVRILANDGTGAFTIAGDYAATPYVRLSASADVDGDGDPDLVVVVGNDAATVLLNQGGLVFSVGQTFACGVAGPLHLADFDRDGDVDAAVGNMVNFATAGVFAPPVDVLGLPPPTQQNAAFADVDADGDVDVFGTSPRRIYLNAGGGAFVPDEFLPDLNGPLFADVDLDGDADALSASFVLYENRTRGLAVERHLRPGAAAGTDVFGPPNGAFALAVSAAQIFGAPVATPYGALRIDPATAAIVAEGFLDAQGRTNVAAFLSSTAGAALVGMSFVFQGAVDDGVLPRLTNARTVTVLSY